MRVANLLLAGLACSPLAARADTPCEAEAIREDASPALRRSVRVEGVGGHGTGVLIGSDGRILTAAHLVGDQRELRVGLPGGPTLTATVLRSDPATDLALIQVEGSGYPCAPLTPGRLGIGATAWAVGHPVAGKDGMSLTKGVVSGYPEQDGRLLMQTDAPISPGFSGGGIFAADGSVAAITSAKLVGTSIEGVGYAVPAERVRAWLEDQPTAAPPRSLRPEAERLRVDGYAVYEADGASLSVGDFATRIGHQGVRREAERVQTAGKRAWIWGVAASPFLISTIYYGQFLALAPPAATQFTQAAVGTAISLGAAGTFTTIGTKRWLAKRRMSYQTFYSKGGLEKAVERYNAGEQP